MEVLMFLKSLIPLRLHGVITKECNINFKRFFSEVNPQVNGLGVRLVIRAEEGTWEVHHVIAQPSSARAELWCHTNL
jgi:hypothetical protein